MVKHRPPDPPAPLSLYEQVQVLVNRVRVEAMQLGHGFEARAALALSIAATLERAEDKYVAGLAKELRAIIAELADGVAREGDETPFGSDLADLGNATKPGKGNARRGRSSSSRAARPAADAMAAPRTRRRARD